MRSVFALPIALVLLTGGASAKDTTIATTLTGVHQLCGANSTNCTGVTCGNTNATQAVRRDTAAQSQFTAGAQPRSQSARRSSVCAPAAA
jgi:hypothetical protein